MKQRKKQAFQWIINIACEIRIHYSPETS